MHHLYNVSIHVLDTGLQHCKAFLLVFEDLAYYNSENV